MDSSTAEILTFDDAKDMYRETERDGSHLLPINKDRKLTDKEVKDGVASFETFCNALGIKTVDKKVIRRAREEYAKALKLGKKIHKKKRSSFPQPVKKGMKSCG